MKQDQVTAPLTRAAMCLRLVILIAAPLLSSPQAAAAPLDLYVMPSQGAIYALDGETLADPQSIIPSELVNTSNGLAVDPLARKLYWIADTESTNTDEIRRSELDGSNVELIALPSGQPTDLKVDPFGGKLYFSEAFTETIKVVNLDGTQEQTLLNADGVLGIDIDFVNEKLYWVEVGTNRLRTSNLNGSGAVDVITSGMTRPIDVDVDPLRRRLYWVELGPEATSGPTNSNGRIWMANLDGTNPVLLADSLFQPVDLVIDVARNSIYWGEGIDAVLYRADLDGQHVSVVADLPFGLYYNLALDALPIVPEPATWVPALALGVLPAIRRRPSS